MHFLLGKHLLPRQHNGIVLAYLLTCRVLQRCDEALRELYSCESRELLDSSSFQRHMQALRCDLCI